MLSLDNFDTLDKFMAHVKEVWEILNAHNIQRFQVSDAGANLLCNANLDYTVLDVFVFVDVAFDEVHAVRTGCHVLRDQMIAEDQ